MKRLLQMVIIAAGFLTTYTLLTVAGSIAVYWWARLGGIFWQFLVEGTL